jgi:hypothetical protein
MIQCYFITSAFFARWILSLTVKWRTKMHKDTEAFVTVGGAIRTHYFLTGTK